MRAVYPSLMLTTLLALTACGGGGSSAAPTSTQSSSTPTVQQPSTNNPSDPTTTNNTARVIDYYGDSTVWGCETNTNCGSQAAQPAPVVFDATLTSLGATFSHTTRNEGVSNTDACELLNGGDNVHPAWEQQMTISNATHVIINHGINDVLHAANGQGADHSMSEYRQCLTSLAQIAKAHNKQVIFETPNPVTATDVTDYAQAMREVAASVGAPVIDQFAYLSNKYANNIGAIVPDGLHPSDSIYIDKGQFAAKAFQQLCGNFTCTTGTVTN